MNGTATAGAVQFTIDGVAVGSAVAVGANGKATLTSVQMTVAPGGTLAANALVLQLGVKDAEPMRPRAPAPRVSAAT